MYNIHRGEFSKAKPELLVLARLRELINGNKWAYGERGEDFLISGMMKRQLVLPTGSLSQAGLPIMLASRMIWRRTAMKSNGKERADADRVLLRIQGASG